MKPKVFWGWLVAAGILLAIIGGFIAIYPPVGLPIMGLGLLMMIVGIVMMIPILIKEMKKDDEDMRHSIKEEDLRP